MDLEEKIILHKKISQQIEALEEQKKALSKQILEEMKSSKVEFSDYKAIRYTRLSITTSLQQARLLNATKMEEQIDKTIIKELYNLGHPVEGVKEITYLIISSL